MAGGILSARRPVILAPERGSTILGVLLECWHIGTSLCGREVEVGFAHLHLPPKIPPTYQESREVKRLGRASGDSVTSDEQSQR